MSVEWCGHERPEADGAANCKACGRPVFAAVLLLGVQVLEDTDVALQLEMQVYGHELPPAA